MDLSTVSFEIDADLYAEAEQIAREQGVTVADIGREAFVAWMLGAQQTRRNDLDELGL